MAYPSRSLGEDTDVFSTTRPRAQTPEPRGGFTISTSADQLAMRRGSSDDDGAAHDATLSRSNPMPVVDLGGSPESRPRGRRRTSFLFDLGSDLGDNKAIPSGFIGAVPPSFTTQMAYATGMHRQPSPDQHQNRLSKLVLARMNNIEEGFREVLKEVKDLRREESSRSQSQSEDLVDAMRERKRRGEKKEGKKRSQGSRKTKTSSEGQLSNESSA